MSSSFRVLRSSTGILLHPLALWRAVLPKAHLTSLSRIGGSGWWRSFFCSFSVYSCHLFLIISASVRSLPFLSFIEPIFAWNVPLVSLIFLKTSLVFSILLFPLFLCIDRWGRLSYFSLLFFGTLHSNGYIFAFLLCFSLPFFSQLVQPITSIMSSSPSSCYHLLIT